MLLKLMSGFMKSSGDGALLMMESTRDGCCQIALVTRDALRELAPTSRAEEFKLQEHIETFSAIAEDKYRADLLERDGRIRLTAEDVARWQILHAA
jgi:hypothetical protein